MLDTSKVNDTEVWSSNNLKSKEKKPLYCSNVKENKKYKTIKKERCFFADFKFNQSFIDTLWFIY